MRITFSGQTVAGRYYSLNCTTGVVDGLVVEPDMELVFPNSTIISWNNTYAIYYMFTPLRKSDGGKYTCTATVNIIEAGITDLHSTLTKIVTVVCKLYTCAKGLSY